ncbi:Phosphate-selective porin [Abditibacterium utsteinense]|uniref:Phosphate-selective porin n=1 Tax=Abditibacterium utsteinense TaxID=1960156 RepID=A0A2S8SVK0_9BACT|nr:porin [Abditibacterium utsteinense]PQV64827.1 Phosphate-selective porin [Abditibacterium utsteinense]
MNQNSLFLSRRTLGAIAGLVGASVALSGVPAQAQQSEIDLLRQQLTEMQARLDKLEANKVDVKAAAPFVNSSSKLPVTVSGLLQVHSLNFFNEDARTGGTRGTDTFRLRRGEIRLTAPTITDKISGTVMFDPAKTTSFRGNSSTGQIRERDNILQEIQVSYQLNKGANSSNFIDVGQYKIPIGYESLVSSAALPTVERALQFTQRDPFDGGYGDVRDTGIQLRGNAGQFDYRLGVFNGLGDRQNGLALSDAKAILGRVSFKPKSIAGLEIGVSGGKGNTGVNNFVTTTNEAGVTSTSTVVRRADRNLFNAFAAYKRDKLTLQGEYLTGKATPIAIGTTSLAGRDIQGYYAHVGYYLRPQLEGVLRYDTLDTNRDADDAKVNDITLGLNYYLKGNNAKIQTNLIRRSGDDGAPAALRDDRYELRTNFQVAF